MCLMIKSFNFNYVLRSTYDSMIPMNEQEHKKIHKQLNFLYLST